MGIKRRGGSVAPSRPRAAPAPSRSAAAPAQHSQPQHSSQSYSQPSSNAMMKHQPHQQPVGQQSHMPQQHHPQQQSMMHQQPMQQSMMQAPQQGGGMMGSIGSGIMSGMTFGVGSSIAHRATDALLGPRSMQVEHVGVQPQAAEQPQQQAMHQQQQPMMHQQQPDQKCGVQLEYFQRCMQLNNFNLDTCAEYSTSLQQCQRQ